MSVNVGMKELSAVKGLMQASLSLIFRPQGGIYQEEWQQAHKNALVLKPTPSNSELNVLDDLIHVVHNKPGICFEVRPYWDNNLEYQPLEVFSTAIQWTDYVDALPKTTIPPESDVRSYAEWVIGSNRRLVVREQFDQLLNITGSLIGAANLGMFAHRHFARGSERRAFPGITVTPQVIAEWSNHLAQFDSFENTARSDGPGDTYYFYTQMFAAMVFGHKTSALNYTAKIAFKNGVSIMQLATRLAGESTITTHETAAAIGWNVGLALLDKFVLAGDRDH